MSLTNAERQQRWREKQKNNGDVTLRLTLSKLENERLQQVAEFYSWPDGNLAINEAVQLMIHAFHKQMERTKQTIGKCQHCNEQLPQGCAKLQAGGLFKGNATCFHTTNRLRIGNAYAN